MVLEYVEGGDCAVLLKNTGGPLPLDLARSAQTPSSTRYSLFHFDLIITVRGSDDSIAFGIAARLLFRLFLCFHDNSRS